jgi:hypothetical protein
MSQLLLTDFRIAVNDDDAAVQMQDRLNAHRRKHDTIVLGKAYAYFYCQDVVKIGMKSAACRHSILLNSQVFNYCLDLFT